VSLTGLEEAAARDEAERYILPLERLLPGTPAVTVRPEAEARVRNGCLLGPADLEPPLPDFGGPEASAGPARLLSQGGKLLALARPSPDGAGLHPFLVIT
jgi:hypothetical protein